MFAKQRSKGRFGPRCANRSQGLAEQKHSTVVVRHSERKAVLPVASLELPLEVRGPDLVRPCRFQTNGSASRIACVGSSEGARVDPESR